MARRNIVIVGGGGAGVALSRILSQSLDMNLYSLSLISAREYFLHLPGALRMLTSSKDSLEKKVMIPYDRLFSNGKGVFVNACVTVIEPNSQYGGKVILDRGTEVPYDVLILATGSIWEGALDMPQSREDTEVNIHRWRGTVADAKAVAIIGGGAVGCELAGEIRDIYPDKEITIIHRDRHLLNGTYPDKFRIDVEKRFTNRQIHLVLDDEYNGPIDDVSQIVTKKGIRIRADLIIPCRGGRPNTSFITSSLGQGVVNAQGYVKVLPTLQLIDHPGIFAMGDIIAWNEVKQVFKYGGHAKTVAANVRSYLEERPLDSRYKSIFEVLFLTNGATGGAAYVDLLWGICFGNWVTKILKSNHLFIKQAMQNLGY